MPNRLWALNDESFAIIENVASLRMVIGEATFDRLETTARPVTVQKIGLLSGWHP